MLERHAFNRARQTVAQYIMPNDSSMNNPFSVFMRRSQQFSCSCSIAIENLEVRYLQVSAGFECDDTGQWDFDL